MRKDIWSGLRHLKKIGSGKSASVYRARLDGRPVVVRHVRFKIRMMADEVASIAEEARERHRTMRAKLGPRIPKLIRTVVGDGSFLQVMERVRGKTLNEIKALSKKQCEDLRVLVVVMWRLGLSHGDLTGGNVIWSADKRRWMLVDLDASKLHGSYGSARRRDERLGVDPSIVRALRGCARSASVSAPRASPVVINLTTSGSSSREQDVP